MESQAVGHRAGTSDSGHPLAALSWRRAGGRSLALLGLFVLVAASVELGWWGGLDQSVRDWAGTNKVSWPWDTAKTVFDVASPTVVLPATLVLGLLLAWRRHQWGMAGEAAIRLGLVVASVLLVKPLLAVPGPRNSLGDHGGAFPSGHTTAAVVCVALLLAWARWPRRVTGRVAIAAVVVALVGGSVIYIRYHHVSDVIGGIVLGLLIATLPLPVLRHREAAG